ncbi:TRAP transporter small permease [Maledivibacter halophilus]|uniref:TRAP-type C4-dicarboxylate transport system, small permease component n=1 Tax=Maledivibacter halophilus TaxID=36842 RepID=A0A1T5KQ36_9FIRM|nr:TRAP transporter small permease [Maledivibacter halophilus]SKC65876.1 TRAP-type C4-dicarboxylate transport system, small permease component [Maledivibacter halophilus]
MERYARKMISFINGIRKILNGLIILLFLSMTIVVIINVFARFVLNSPIPWAGEMSRYSFIGVIYLGAVLAVKDQSHIGLDIFIDYFPPKIRKFIDTGSKILILIFLIVFTYKGIEMVLNNLNTKSAAMLIPMAIPYAALPIGGMGMIFELVAQLLKIENVSENERMEGK